MYQITVIENADELLHALNTNRMKGDDFPRITEVNLIIDTDSISLECEDRSFDISEVSPIEVLNKVLKNRSINLEYITTR